MYLNCFCSPSRYRQIALECSKAHCIYNSTYTLNLRGSKRYTIVTPYIGKSMHVRQQASKQQQQEQELEIYLCERGVLRGRSTELVSGQLCSREGLCLYLPTYYLYNKPIGYVYNILMGNTPTIMWHAMQFLESLPLYTSSMLTQSWLAQPALGTTQLTQRAFPPGSNL